MKQETEETTQPAKKVVRKKEVYKPKKGEEGSYHVKQEQVRFDPNTGERLSKAVICQYEPRVWMRSIEKNLKALGYTYEVLHTPSK